MLLTVWRKTSMAVTTAATAVCYGLLFLCLGKWVFKCIELLYTRLQSLMSMIFHTRVKPTCVRITLTTSSSSHSVCKIHTLIRGTMYICNCNTCSRLHSHAYICTLFQLHCCFTGLYWLCSCLVFVGLPLVSSKPSIFIPLRYVSNCTVQYVLSE